MVGSHLAPNVHIVCGYLYLSVIHVSRFVTMWTRRLNLISPLFSVEENMKKSNGNSSRPESTTKDVTVPITAASERRPSTVVGFKGEFILAPWSKWANRFVVAAIIQGAIATGITAFLLYDATYDTPGAARTVAAGGAGTWLTVGYLGFLILGPLACAVTSLFYQHLEATLRAPYGGASNVLAWLHLVLMNVGVTGATVIMLDGGWRAGNLTYTLQQQTNPTLSAGAIAGQVHVQILGGLPPYIAVLGALAIIGAFAGGLGYVMAWRHASKGS